ncbi:uncharacterized protein LOC116416516 [Nasonia vitripennis]|uniref:Uncharacterized protein n=1 Tax=Nasonia vitripennis TaxID=7425 RepID=A0A7M7Q568_NASVI|nr:uncharacterized protein LOC116416516 [Nasonia vitripennis]
MDIHRYKRYQEFGDEAISKRSAYRHRNIILPSRNHVEKTRQFSSIGSESINDIIDQNQSNTEVEDCDQITTFTEYENDLQEYLHRILLEDKITDSSPATKNPKSLNDMIKDINFFKPLSISACVRQGELLLMVLKHCLSNNTSVSAMSNLCRMINTIFQTEVMPNSRYFLDQLFDSMDKVEFHAVCPNCTAYIGQFNEIRDVKSCHTCTSELNLENPSNTSFFVLMDPSS